MPEAYSWPEGLSPDVCPIYTRNELTMTAPIERVWAHLIRAVDWPAWYPNAKGVRLADGGADLAMNTEFSWNTFGVRVHTKVTEFVPMRRLSWYGTGLGSRGYHTWTIEPAGQSCHVITEEVQRGLFVSLGRWYFRRGLLRYHQIWLEGLDKRANERPGEAP